MDSCGAPTAAQRLARTYNLEDWAEQRPTGEVLSSGPGSRERKQGFWCAAKGPPAEERNRLDHAKTKESWKASTSSAWTRTGEAKRPQDRSPEGPQLRERKGSSTKSQRPGDKNA